MEEKKKKRKYISDEKLLELIEQQLDANEILKKIKVQKATLQRRVKNLMVRENRFIEVEGLFQAPDEVGFKGRGIMIRKKQLEDSKFSIGDVFKITYNDDEIILSKKKKFQYEIKHIDSMISQSKRFGYQFGVMVVELSHSIPRGISKILPGETISFSVIEKSLRLYDRVVDCSYRRYYVVLPQTDENGVKAVSERIRKLAQEHDWGDVTINTAIYPKDGDTSQTLLSKLF